MSENRLRMRGENRRNHQRARERLPNSRTGEEFERRAKETRRLLEGDELLTQWELERFDYQLSIDEVSRHTGEWHEAELTQYKEQNDIRNTRAWILTGFLLVLCVWGTVSLVLGEAPVIDSTGMWDALVSVWRDVF